MKEALEYGKESSHSAHANGVNVKDEVYTGGLCLCLFALMPLSVYTAS